jgi:hypothetical protein
MPYVGTQPRPPAPSSQVTLWYLRLENQDIAAKADIVINQLIKTQTHRRTKSNIETRTKQILNAL